MWLPGPRLVSTSQPRSRRVSAQAARSSSTWRKIPGPARRSFFPTERDAKRPEPSNVASRMWSTQLGYHTEPDTEAHASNASQFTNA